MQAKFITSAADRAGFPEDAGREVAVVGRSNSGKSSAINRIVGHGRLARVSKTPGRTQLINFFDLGGGSRLVDLPGYGFARVPAKVRAQWRTLMDAYFGTRRSLAGLLITVDIRRGLKETDEQMLAWAESLGCPATILLTKCDKLSRGAGSARRHEVERAIAGRADIVQFSALDGTGVEAARALLQRYLADSSDQKKARAR